MKSLKKFGLELLYKRKINILKFFGSKEKVELPKNLIIELTRNCNGHCIMCSRKKQSYNPEYTMPLDSFKKLADEVFPTAASIDLRGFGESTIIPNFLEYAKYASKFDCKLGLVTNLNKKNDSMWDFLVKNNFWIAVSFDGATKKTFEKIRRGNKFENVSHNLKLLSNLFKKYKRDKKDFFFITVVQRDNIKEIPEIVKLGAKLGVGKIKLSPVRTGTDDPISLDNYKKDVEKYIPQSVSLGVTLGVNISMIGSFGLKNVEQKLNLTPKKDCSKPWSFAYITYNNFVGPCNHLLDPPFVLGKITNNFSEVWDNSAFFAFREVINTRYRPRFCKWCKNNRFD